MKRSAWTRGDECSELVAAVGESNFQETLSRVCGSSRWEDVRFDCIAALVREPNNPYDSNAISVIQVEGQIVGYLSREDAKAYGPFVATHGVDACRARIAGRGPGSETQNLGIFLELPPP
jgi:hypothetical protein